METIPKMKDMGVLKRLALKLISKLQLQLLKSQSDIATDLYYSLSKLHFKIYFQKDLMKEVLDNSELSVKAVDRHARLVIKALYSDKDQLVQNHLAAATRGAYVKNLILNASV